MYEILKNVDEDRLYNHIIETMGPNDPVFNQDKLDAAADYILSQFQHYGLEVSEHVFEIEGKSYRNIEGLINTGDGPELFVTSHYDTVPKAPGADDNLSGVSVMLESARILAASDKPLNVRFIGFTLEEAHPNRFVKEYVSAQELGLMDEQFNFKNLHTSLLRKKFGEYITQGMQKGRTSRESIDLFFDEYKNQMNEPERTYFDGLGEFWGFSTLDAWIGNNVLAGSTRWVEDRAHSIDIAGVVNLDTVGYISQKPNSQSFPEGLSPEMLQKYHVDDPSVGNYLVGIADVNSGSVLTSFASSCKLEEVQLPFAWLHAPFGFDVLKERMFDLLRTDCTPFWRRNIPAIFIVDAGEFRTPYYHTQADTIDKLDFNVIAKLCKATIATAMNSP